MALLLFFGAPAVHAGPPPLPRASAPPAPATVTAWSWFSPIESLLQDRRRMIQALIIMMCVGLYVMWRK